MKGYREFCVEGGNWKYGGQYWNGVKQFKRTIEAKFKKRGITTSFVYNNVIKIGKAWDKGTPSKNILEWESHWFTVIGGEVEIMKPDIILFFSGPGYDQYIARTFGSFETEQIGNWNTRQLARIVSDRLPSATIRTCHPNYLWRNGFSNYLTAIVKAIDC